MKSDDREVVRKGPGPNATHRLKLGGGTTGYRLPIIYDEQLQPGQLGSCAGIPMNLYACYVCSAAMVACYLGHSVDPVALNSDWTAHEGSYGYVAGCDAQDIGLTGTFPDIAYRGRRDGTSAPSTVDFSAGEAAIVHIYAQATLGYPDHFLALDHVDGGAVIAADPWVGDFCDVVARYGNVVEGVIVYYMPPRPKPGTSLPPDTVQQAMLLR